MSARTRRVNEPTTSTHSYNSTSFSSHTRKQRHPEPSIAILRLRVHPIQHQAPVFSERSVGAELEDASTSWMVILGLFALSFHLTIPRAQGRGDLCTKVLFKVLVWSGSNAIKAHIANQ